MFGDHRVHDGGQALTSIPFGDVHLLGVCDDCDIVQEANHRIANHLAILAAFVRLKAMEVIQGDGANDPGNTAVLLASVGDQIEGVARVHRALSVGEGLEQVDVSEHLHEVCSQLAAAAPSTVTMIEEFVPGCLAPSDQALPLTQIVSEVVSNAIKHAGRNGRPCRINVRSGKDAAGAIAVDVVDDGPGLPDGVTEQEGGGTGFRLMRALSWRLGARVTIDSNASGTRFRVVLPTRD